MSTWSNELVVRSDHFYSTRVDSYLHSLFDTALPLTPWFVVVAWATLFVANHAAARAARAANDAQSLVRIDDWNALRRAFTPRYVAAQVVFAAIVFTFAFLLGGAAFAFFAGGLLVASTCGIALNFQALMSARALAQPDAAKGALTLSTAAAFRQMAARAGGMAIGCALLGLVVAHLALLGGAFFLAATAGGYWSRARRARAPA